MKVEIGKIPIRISLEEPKVGNVYRAKGGRGSTCFWLLVAMGGGDAMHMLGLDRDGNIVSTASYTRGAIDGREVVGFVPGIEDVKLNMEWHTI